MPKNVWPLLLLVRINLVVKENAAPFARIGYAWEYMLTN